MIFLTKLHALTFSHPTYIRGGLNQYSSLQSVSEGRENEESEDDEDYIDDMSKLSMDGDSVLEFGGSVISRESDFKSHHHKIKPRGSSTRHVKDKFKYCGTTSIGLPFVMDKWKTTVPESVVGLKVQMLSGRDIQENTRVRVATNQESLVIETPLSIYATEPELAFQYIIEDRKRRAKELRQKVDKNSVQMMEMVLAVHTKTIARKTSVKSLRNNDPGLKKVVLTQRINLPFKVKHRFTTKDSDEIFYGKKFVQYPGKYI